MGFIIQFLITNCWHLTFPSKKIVEFLYLLQQGNIFSVQLGPWSLTPIKMHHWCCLEYQYSTNVQQISPRTARWLTGHSMVLGLRFEWTSVFSATFLFIAQVAPLENILYHFHPYLDENCQNWMKNTVMDEKGSKWLKIWLMFCFSSFDQNLANFNISEKNYVAFWPYCKDQQCFQLQSKLWHVIHNINVGSRIAFHSELGQF